MYGQLQFPVENSGPRVRNMGWHRGDAAGGLEEEPVLAPDAASGLSGPSGKEIGGRACSSDLQSSEIWVLDVISSISFSSTTRLRILVLQRHSCKWRLRTLQVLVLLAASPVPASPPVFAF